MHCSKYREAAGVGAQGMMQCTTSQSIPHHALNLRGALLTCCALGQVGRPNLPPRQPPGRSTLRSLSETTKLRPTPSAYPAWSSFLWRRPSIIVAAQALMLALKRMTLTVHPPRGALRTCSACAPLPDALCAQVSVKFVECTSSTGI